MEKTLVILSNNFGTNFSGGCLATCRIFQPLEKHFKSIFVISEKIGEHEFKNIQHLSYQNKQEAVDHINKLKNTPGILFYGDFHMTSYFITAKVPYYFTYHDNWPEQANLDFISWLQSFHFIPLYQKIIKNAKAVFHVSYQKYDHYKLINKNSYLVRNGINQAVTKTQYQQPKSEEPIQILMLGNIDKRKFGLLPQLLDKLSRKWPDFSFKLSIYGEVKDKALVENILKYKNLTIHGYQKEIDFSQIDLLLMTSQMENLSIAACDALANLTPVIAFKVGGLNEVVSNGNNGFLIPHLDVERMAEILSNFPTYCFDFSGQQLAEFSWTKAADKYAEIMGLKSENEINKPIQVA